MNTVQVKCEHPVPNLCGIKYKGLAFDGCYFYLTCPDLCTIVKYDKHFCEDETVKTQKAYTSICFDQKHKCFWAAASKCPCKLFKLDCCLREIDFIKVTPCDNCGSVITGVSYDCMNDRLVATFTNCIVSVDPQNPQNHIMLQKSTSSWFTGVLSVAPSLITSEMQNGKQCLIVYDEQSQLKYRLDIPNEYIFETVVFKPCKNITSFYVLAIKNGCYPYILEVCEDCCNIDICGCNYCIGEDNSCHDDCDTSHCDKRACCEIIESVALIETALSHILNAEGEKLQKIIASTDDIDKILCANELINTTILNVTHLEIILHDKLTIIKDFCNHCNEDTPCHDCKPCKNCGCNNCDCDCDNNISPCFD
ncbi:MAG: hypothetical protein RRZ73_01540 [Oscillospiraceae bacterium]